jgi:transposase
MHADRYRLTSFNSFEFEQNVRNTACSVYPEYPTRRQNEGGFFACRLIGTDHMNILKQVAGIDVAQKELVVSLGRMQDDLTTEIYGFKTFPNTEKGFKDLISWVTRFTTAEVPVNYVMEATGVYHESLAYYLTDNGHRVSIVMPNKMSNYQKTLEVKTITDKTASQAIVSYGLEKKLTIWEKPRRLFKELRQLTRERGQLIDQRTVVKNQLHSEQSEAFPNPKSLERMQAQIQFFVNQEKEVMEEIKALIKQDKEVSKSVELICSIPGIGLLTAATILAETNNFNFLSNKKQLTSFAGLDVKEKQSGTSVKGKPKISKRGNRHLRKAMHLPALTAIRHDERYKSIFARLVARHGIKMKAAVAVQRKLLELAYIVFKTNKPYDKEYLKNKIEKQEAA